MGQKKSPVIKRAIFFWPIFGLDFSSMTGPRPLPVSNIDSRLDPPHTCVAKNDENYQNDDFPLSDENHQSDDLHHLMKSLYDDLSSPPKAAMKT